MADTRGKIDLQKLKREMLEAKEAEVKYIRENDAKFRAIRQGVNSYEEFRDIVKASNLKPLNRQELLETQPSQPWNVAAGDVFEQSPPRMVKLGGEVPTTQQEFMRAWRGAPADNPNERYRLIMTLRTEGLKRIFPVQMNMEILGDIIQALNQVFLTALPTVYNVAVEHGRSDCGRPTVITSYLNLDCFSL